MEWVEVRAENIEAAEELALDQLGVAREDAEFEVVTREENRLFGLKKTEARVRARVKPADLPSKTNNNRKRSKNNNKNQKSNKTAPKNSNKSNKNNKNNKDNKTQNTKPTQEDREPMPLKEQEDAVIEFLQGVIASFQIDASASTRMEEERIIGSIDGEDVGLLIGPKAGTLLALQDITRTVVQRHASGKKTNRLSVDVGGYREKRKAEGTWGTIYLRIGDGETCPFELIAFWLFFAHKQCETQTRTFAKVTCVPKSRVSRSGFTNSFLLRLIETCPDAMRAVSLLSCYRVPNSLGSRSH